MLLDGQTAVVTGGASGLGREISLTFARNGADVIVADIRETPRSGGAPTHERISRETDRQAYYVECDVTDPEDLRVAVEAADEIGGVDVMVNNAGIYEPESFLEVSEAQFDRILDVNLKGVFFGAQAAARKMLETDGGTIINMSSVAGITGVKDIPVYSASKGGVRLLTYSLADRFGPEGIRVNAIHPGFTRTQMLEEADLGTGVKGRIASAVYKRLVPQRRYGEPEEVAKAALYLASDMSSYVNGESLVVDGGFTSTG